MSSIFLSIVLGIALCFLFVHLVETCCPAIAPSRAYKLIEGLEMKQQGELAESYAKVQAARDRLQAIYEGKSS